jgi:very-short-patch-repair endonuclease
VANERARQLRNNATAVERKLWYKLRALKISGPKFRRQVPIDHYIVDFACLSRRLIVEVDGATHATNEQIESDASRPRDLGDHGFKVLRFQNADIVTNIDGVMDEVVVALDVRTPTPNPSPQGGGE